MFAHMVSLSCNDKTPNTECIKVASEQAIRYYMKKMNYASGIGTYRNDPELDGLLREVACSWELGSDILPYLEVGVHFAQTAFRHVSRAEARMVIVLYTAFLAYIDNPSKASAFSLRDINRTLCDRSLLSDPGFLGELARLLAKTWDIYPYYSANTILISTMRFITATLLENSQAGVADIPPQALRAIEYQREMSGIAEAYVCFLWDKADLLEDNAYLNALPDAGAHLSYVNDIFSFYKEELSGDTTTYIYRRARATGKSSLESLYELIDETVAASERVRAILGEGPARDVWDSFNNAYIDFHMGTPRYRLHEIFGSNYKLDISRQWIAKGLDETQGVVDVGVAV